MAFEEEEEAAYVVRRWLAEKQLGEPDDFYPRFVTMPTATARRLAELLRLETP